jgi:alanine racemase
MASAALQQLGDQAPENGVALGAAMHAIQHDNARLAKQALARAAVLLQVRYDAAHHQPRDANVDPVKEAASQVGLSHQFDSGVLDDAAASLSDSALATAAGASASVPAVSLTDARSAIRSGLDEGLDWQQAVNAARVQCGGLKQNETVLDEAALTILGDELASGRDAAGGHVLTDAAHQLAGLHLFADADSQAALAALTITPKPSDAPGGDAARVIGGSAVAAWATLRRDQASKADTARIAQDEAAWHQALASELDAAANKPAGAPAGWLADPSQSDLRWMAQQAVIGADTTKGLSGAPSQSELLISLGATRIVGAAEAVRGAGGPSASANLKAAQALTQELQGLPADSALGQEAMRDARTVALQRAALADITGVRAGSAPDTLVAEGAALSRYRNTILFQPLLRETLASRATQHTLQAVQTPASLADIADLLKQVAAASPQVAQALLPHLRGRIIALIHAGPDCKQYGMETAQQHDSYFGPLARIVEAAGGPHAGQTQPLVNALKTELQQLRTRMTREQRASQYSTENPFQALGWLRDRQLRDPMSLYQMLIDEEPGSDLGKTLAQYTGLKAQAAPITPAKADAGSLATAWIALDKLDDQSGAGPVDAHTLQKTLADAGKTERSISDVTWAEAELAERTREDAAAINAGTAKAPGDLVEQASHELSAEQLFDADTLDAATRALQSGRIAPGARAPRAPMAAQPGQPSADAYLQGLVASGTTMPEAIALTRAWLGGGADTELVLTQAALTIQGQQSLPAYYKDRSGSDPIELAARQLEAMQVLDPATIELAVNGRPAKNGQPAVTGMRQRIAPDIGALDGAHGRPGLIEAVDRAYAAWQSAQAKARASRNDSTAQKAEASALERYHAALSAALDAAAGRASGDSGWQTDPAYVDTIWQAQNTLEMAALGQQIEAAQYAGEHSPQAAALDSALQRWQTGLDALRILGQVQAARLAATPRGAEPCAGDVAAAQALTSASAGLEQGDPQVYQQVMGDGAIDELARSALASITAAAAPPTVSTGRADPGPSVQAKLHAMGMRLQSYSGTVLYAQLLDGVANARDTQHLFRAVHASIAGQTGEAGKLKTLADALEGAGPDLAAMLMHQLFGKGAANSAFSPAQLLAWAKRANDLTQLARIYVACGGARNADMTALRFALERMVAGDANFGHADTRSRLNARSVVAGRCGQRQGEDLGFGDQKGNGTPMQLAQDMLDDNPAAAVGIEIARETGVSNLGKPAAPVAAGHAALASAAAFVPGEGPVLTQGGHWADLPWQDGMQTLTSYDALLNAVGEANDLKADNTPATLADEHALANGQFALYNRNDTAFDGKGHRTTLGQLARSLMRGEGVTAPDASAPATVASLSGQWWTTRTPALDQPATDFTLLEGLAADGREIDVGPADTTAREGYVDWQHNTGFDNGDLLVQPHWVTDAAGVVQTGQAYLVEYRPYEHWYSWDNVLPALQMALTVAAGITAMITQPESAPLWLALLSEASDVGFAVSAAAGTAGALKRLAAPGGAHNWVNWLDLAANGFGGGASSMGALVRAGTMMDRLAAGTSGFADVAHVTALARTASSLEFARAELAAQCAGERAIRMFDDSWLASGLARPLTASARTMQRTSGLAEKLRLLQKTRVFRVTGRAATLANAVSMGQQFNALAQAGGQASVRDWLNLLTSAGLTASGAGIERMRAGDAATAAAREQAVKDALSCASSPAASPLMRARPMIASAGGKSTQLNAALPAQSHFAPHAGAAAVSAEASHAWLEIDREAYESNLRLLQHAMGESNVCAIMKADAYGHGIALLMPSIIKTGVTYIGIASNDEARIARESGYTGALLRVRAATLEEIKGAFAYDVEESMGNAEIARTAGSLAYFLGRTLKVHLALNSGGMSRNGLELATGRGKDDALAIIGQPGLEVVGVMTHFADEDKEAVKASLVRFKRDAAWLFANSKLERSQVIVHCANSFAALEVPEARLDMVRPGWASFGEPAPSWPLRPVMEFKSRVASINHYPEGNTVGYGREFRTTRDSKLANIPVGYSDGYPRAFGNEASVLINGQRVPVVGKISMNTIMADVTDLPDVRPGDEVVLYGRQGDDEITLTELQDVYGDLLAGVYTVWGNSNRKVLKGAPASQDTLIEAAALLAEAARLPSIGEPTGLVDRLDVTAGPSRFYVTADGQRVLQLDSAILLRPRMEQVEAVLHELAHAAMHARRARKHARYVGTPSRDEQTAQRYARIAASSSNTDAVGERDTA